VFTTPTIDSFQLQHERELKEILIPYIEQDDFVREVSNNNSDYVKISYRDFWNKIVQHTQKYNWLFYSYMGPAYTEQDFIDIVRDMISNRSSLAAEIKAGEENHARIVAKRKELIEKINPTSFESQILNIAEKMVWAKPRRKDYQSKSYYHLSFLLKEIATRLNLTLGDVFFCTIQMLQEGLRGNLIDKKAIESVKKLHVVIPFKDGTVDVFTGVEAEIFVENSIEQKEKIQKSGDLKGTIAYKGSAKGVVKIINKPSEMEKMNTGDILVSLATTPDIVPAMKKAAAIVTDKGGLTCHAAIVARELKVPCIVGTEYATQVLKDGDTVEVDANNGIVKILK
jgi:phosphohistidine swiveling domain-containing protein